MQAKQGHPTLTDAMEWIVNQFPYPGHIVPVQQSNSIITLFVVRQCLKHHCDGEEVSASLRIHLFCSRSAWPSLINIMELLFVLTDALVASCNHIFGLQQSTSIVSQEHTECATMWHLINFFIVIFLLSTLISIRSGLVQVKHCGNGFLLSACSHLLVPRCHYPRHVRSNTSALASSGFLYGRCTCRYQFHLNRWIRPLPQWYTCPSNI